MNSGNCRKLVFPFLKLQMLISNIFHRYKVANGKYTDMTAPERSLYHVTTRGTAFGIRGDLDFSPFSTTYQFYDFGQVI